MKRIPLASDRIAMADLVLRALKEDIGTGDLTTRRVVPRDRLGIGTIQAKERLVLAGLPVAREVFRQVDESLRFTECFREGSLVPRGSVVARVRGLAASILTGERTAMNFLQHLSGIATYTASCVGKAGGQCAIRDTRKTHPGLRDLEKYAVRLGGGENHRHRLDDGILIKHNHWRLSGGVGAAVARARRLGARGRRLPIQVEVSTPSDLRQAMAAGADIVLLDNLTPRQIRHALAVARGRIPVELSGRISRSKIPRFAALGADFLAMGALTHSAGWADLSLRLEPDRP